MNFFLCSALCADWSRHEEIGANGGVKSISKMTFSYENKKGQNFNSLCKEKNVQPGQLTPFWVIILLSICLKFHHM